MKVGQTWEMTSGVEDLWPWIITVIGLTVDRITFLVLTATGSEELEGTIMEMPLGWSEEVPVSWRLL